MQVNAMGPFERRRLKISRKKLSVPPTTWFCVKAVCDSTKAHEISENYVSSGDERSRRSSGIIL